jgi:hypothetical protein
MAKPSVRPWTITEKARNIHHIAIELAGARDERWFLLQSDVHWDNPHCDRDLFLKHLAQAKERDAAVLDNGDFFCVMQGKWDTRSNKNDLRPEHQVGDYLDALVRTAAGELEPYKHLLTVRGKGNHETSITKRHETDLTERLVERMRMRGSDTICTGGYSGYVIFQITHCKTRRQPLKLFYHHGFGGGGPVTRGVIQTNRQAVFIADADVILTGHTHDHWQVPIARVKLNQDNTAVVHTRQVHVRAAGYKEEYGDGYSGWHIERGAAPKPIGGLWLRIWQENRDTIDWEITEAR